MKEVSFHGSMSYSATEAKTAGIETGQCFHIENIIDFFI